MKRVMAGAAIAALTTIGAASASAAQQPAPAAAAVSLPAAERAALLPVKQAVDARNWPLATSLIPAARASVRSADGRYALGRLELDAATGSQNRAAYSEALQRILETRRGSNAEQTDLLRQYASIMYDVGSYSTVEGALNRALQLTPEDPESLSMLGQLNRNRGNTQQALAFFQRASRASEAAARPLPEARYKLGFAMAEQANQRGVAMEIARPFIAAYPSAVNWRDVLTAFRTLGTVDAAQTIDAWRLMKASGALSGERDYLAAATAFNDAGLAGEAIATLEEGVSRRMLGEANTAARTIRTAAQAKLTRDRAGAAALLAQGRDPAGTATQARTAADTLLSLGRYAEAAELYRAATLKVGEDAGLLNARLGIALAMAGQRPEAQAAFRASTGAYADLAGLWAIWLARRPA